MHIVSYQDFACPSAVLVHHAVTQNGGDPKKAVVAYEDNRRPAVTFTAPVSFNMIRIGKRFIRLSRAIRIPGLHSVRHMAIELHNLDVASEPGMLIYSGVCDGQPMIVKLPREFNL